MQNFSNGTTTLLICEAAAETFFPLVVVFAASHSVLVGGGIWGVVWDVNRLGLKCYLLICMSLSFVMAKH